jgi:hypothetical protein
MPVLTGSDTSADNPVATFARDAVMGIADYARSFGGGGGVKPADAVSRETAAAPADPLLDLTLPESLRAWLKPAAEALGLSIEDGNARDKYGRLQRRVTYLTDNGEIRRTLLHIPPKVLTDPNAYASLGMVMWAIEKNAFVAVFAENLPAPAPVNANVIDALWKERPMDSRFIAWAFVNELPTLDLVDQIEFMRTRLDLETLTPRTRSTAAGAGEVTVKDIDRIVAILCARGDFNDTRGRSTLLTQAGLNSFAGVIKLEGASKQVGIDLVWQLTQHQTRVPPDNHTALGALLRTIMAFSDTPPADASWLQVLITRCEL